MRYLIGDKLATAIKDAWSTGTIDDRLGVLVVCCGLVSVYISAAQGLYKLIAN